MSSSETEESPTSATTTPARPDVPLDGEGIARVNIYGTGITGLTAAHELAIRGFRVRVIEPAQECDETGQLEGAPRNLGRRMAIGGVARTQFHRVERGAPGNFQGGSEGERSDSFRCFLEYPPDFVPGKKLALVPAAVVSVLKDFLTRCGVFEWGDSQGVLHIRIPPGEDAKRQRQRRVNANALRRYLTRASPWPVKLELARVLVLTDQEIRALEPVLDLPPRLLKDEEGLLLEVLHFLPGEHGFRFFPSYYRHLFSTMRETPILDEKLRTTGRTVYDNLVPSSFYGIASEGRRIRFLRRAPATRPVELLQELKDLASSGYPATDTLQFTLRLWRYMCTCPERRKKEYEPLSWSEYLEGYDLEKKTRRYKYSEKFMRDMQFAPRVLAAFDGKWGDARTNGNTLVQLYLNNLLPLPKTDGTLNGPTTLAWLRPWRRYLNDFLKVEFYQGELKPLGFNRHTRQLKAPRWMRTIESRETADVKVDYHLIATDAATAERLTKDLPAIGVIAGLRGFTTTVPANPRGDQEARQRPEGEFPGREPWDRFQTLTGIQFFFPSSFRLAEGYIYFLDAPWGLSAINSQHYWATPPTLTRDGFGAVLSVDIGNWFLRDEEPSPPGDPKSPSEKPPSPSDCSRDELATEVWRQIKQATELHKLPLPNMAPYNFALPPPAWYHLDRNLQFKGDTPASPERPVGNLAPYLIPIVGDWKHRPGTEPWDPLSPPPPSEAPPLPEGLWQAKHGGYPVHWGRLVFAGTYLKTFTRMTTMEAANESARHAVNAIIDHYLETHDHPERSRPLSDRGDSPEAPGQKAVSGGTPGFRMTPIGEYCRIWDPEQHELPELMPLRELDAKLFAANLPHVWDVLHLEPLALPLIPALDSPGGVELLKSFLGRVREFRGATPGAVWPGVKGAPP